METEKEEEEDSPEEYVALTHFSARGSDQVRPTQSPLPVFSHPSLALTLLSLCLSSVLAAGTNCWSTPSLRQSGGGQSWRGPQVMSPPATCALMALRKMRTAQCTTRGRMKSTSAATEHWLETGNNLYKCRQVC